MTEPPIRGSERDARGELFNHAFGQAAPELVGDGVGLSVSVIEFSDRSGTAQRLTADILLILRCGFDLVRATVNRVIGA